MWSYEAGLHVDCEHSSLLMQNLESMDKNGNPTFKEPYKSLIEEQKQRFINGSLTQQDFPEGKGLFIAMKQYAMYAFEEPEGKELRKGFSLKDINENDARTFKDIFESNLVDEEK